MMKSKSSVVISKSADTTFGAHLRTGGHPEVRPLPSPRLLGRRQVGIFGCKIHVPDFARFGIPRR